MIEIKTNDFKALIVLKSAKVKENILLLIYFPMLKLIVFFCVCARAYVRACVCVLNMRVSERAHHYWLISFRVIGSAGRACHLKISVIK